MATPFTLDFPEALPAERRDTHWWVKSDGLEVRLSNLTKVFWPDAGYTKGDLLAYYWNVAPFILPHLSGRPLTLKRMPDGIEGSHFYQKNAPDHTSEWMPRCAIEPEDGKIDELLMVERTAHLLFAVSLRVTMEWRVSQRTGRVFIDHNMNRRAASLAAPYSVRPLPGAPVSTPLDWNEIEQAEVRPEMFRIDNIMDRLSARDDLFAPVAQTGQTLDSALERLGIGHNQEDVSQGRVRRAIAPSQP